MAGDASDRGEGGRRMNVHGIEVKTRNIPKLDKDFVPIHQFNQSFLKTAGKPIGIAITRNNAQTAVYHTFIHGTPQMWAADTFYIDRLIKTLLWIKGGYKIYIAGDNKIFDYVKEAYSPGGLREFDREFMLDVYESDFSVELCPKLPDAKEESRPVGGHTEGCRIGFDAGGSNRKVSSVIDGEIVYSEVVAWHPTTCADPDYHFNEIVCALKTAASKMPRVDAIGISSAGVYVNNKTMAASLFLSVPKDLFDRKVKDIYIRAAREIGDVAVTVCNDGDVAALAGAMSLHQNNVLGIAMGTSEAGGFVNRKGNITGWLNELAFVPVDANLNAIKDEWSGDLGCGVKYLSQDAVIKLALAGGITLDEGMTPAEKIWHVQGLLERGHPIARDIYISIGIYLGHTLALYHHFYSFEHVLLLGGVTSGKAGEIITAAAEAVLQDEYPDIANEFVISLPDEKLRRVGLSIAAASLSEIKVKARC